MRIVAGAAKGRRLAPPPAGTRPTSDRVREAMFNTLAATAGVDGARVLDLFAGTGAVGLEALSRGAAEVVFIENSRAALAVLRRNVETVGLPGARVVARSVPTVLAVPPVPPERPFDLVFADPPYAYAEGIADLLTALGAGRWLAPGAHVIVETSARTPTADWADESITPQSERRYGDTLLWYGLAR